MKLSLSETEFSCRHYICYWWNYTDLQGHWFLKQEKSIEKQLAPNLNESELGRELHMRRFKIMKTEGDTMYFSNGTYNQSTGTSIYTIKTLPSFLNKLNGYHKQPSRNPSHILSTVFAILILFLAISSFWMFKPGSKKFRRGILFALVGLVVALFLVYI